jgi:DNA primase
MVEGQLDAIRCWSAGLTSAIAPQGTGITETQLQLLRRFHASVECLLDGDSAGQQAALRLLPKALQENLEIHFLPLPPKSDPDDLVLEQGAGALEKLRANKLSGMGFAVSALAPDPRKLSAQEMSDVCRELFAIVMQASSEVAKTEYLTELSQKLGLPANALETEFRRFPELADRRKAAIPRQNSAQNGDSTAKSAQNAGPTFAPVETDLLLLLLHFEEYGESLARAINHEWIDKSTRAGRLLDAFLNDFEHDMWPGIKEVEQHVDDPEDRNFLASLLFERPSIEDPVKVANDGIRRIVSNFCSPKIAKNQLEIAAKQGNVDADILSIHKANEEFRRLKMNPPVIR